MKKIFFRFRFTRKPAETLIEVIIAIFVVAIGASVATSLITSALQSNSFSRNNLIAINLAVEGLEAVRNIRDTNWLKFSYDKDHCWNMLSQYEQCDQGKLIQPGYYTIDLDVNLMKWSLNDNLTPLDLKKGINIDNNKYLLYFIDFDNSNNADNKGNSSDDHDMYASASAQLPLNGTQGLSSRFYRMIEIFYPDKSSPELAEEMNIISTVQWQERNQIHRVSLTTKLTNYQKSQSL